MVQLIYSISYISRIVSRTGITRESFAIDKYNSSSRDRDFEVMFTTPFLILSVGSPTNDHFIWIGIQDIDGACSID